MLPQGAFEHRGGGRARTFRHHAEAPAFPTFPRTRGLNGLAVATGRPVIANDVATHPRYLTTFAGTGAEMIVPVLDDAGTPVGTIDVESPRVGAFGAAEQALVVECARILRAWWADRRG